MRAKKTNRAGSTEKVHLYDQCGTPAYALDPLIPYLPQGRRLWDPAAGEGLLIKELSRRGFDTVGGDLLTEGVGETIIPGQNFFDYELPGEWIQVTNPPFSTKYKWLQRSFALGHPFALLMPVDVMGAGTAQKLFREYGIEVIWLDKRINYKMPNAGYSGKGAHFSSAWFTYGLDIGKENTFAAVVRRPDSQPTLFDILLKNIKNIARL